MKSKPKVTIVIPHWNGEGILRRCLLSLRRTRYSDYRVLVVNNGSTDGSISMVRREHPEVHMVESPVNLGFAAGCNLGIRASDSPYIVLLNNDTEVTAGWLNPLVNLADSDPVVGAVQAKMRSFQNRDRFDYCGAAGGEMDIFGYPFAMGRIFETIETDTGQYDRVKAVFWASGAATLLRRAALVKTGLLDDYFFAHMEEIDLDWRLQLAGYCVMTAPEAVVYHQTGATLGEERLQKMVLNHRNSILMVLKNYSPETLLWLMPMRLLLEMITMAASVARGQWKRAAAVGLGIWGVIRSLRHVVRKRKEVTGMRVLTDSCLMHRMYRRSIALDYFLFGKRKATDITIPSDRDQRG